MGLSGSLEDISIVDVLQILGMSGKSGVLHIERVEQKIEIGFSKGMIVAASIRPRISFLTDIVVEKGYVTSNQLQRALDKQKDRRLPVGDLLLDSGEITMEKLEKAIMASIQTVIGELASWIDGEFSFELGETSPAADRLFLSDNVSLDVSLSPQELLMEAARIHDEAMAGRTEETRILPPAKTEPEGVEPEQEEVQAAETESRPEGGLDTTPPVLLLTSDALIQNALKEALRHHHIMVHPARTIPDRNRGFSNRFEPDGTSEAVGDGEDEGKDPKVSALDTSFSCTSGSSWSSRKKPCVARCIILGASLCIRIASSASLSV